MSTVDGPVDERDGHPSAPESSEKPRRHSRWLWVSLVLGVVTVGLLIWGLSKNADLNDAQSQVDKQAAASTAATAEAKSAYEDVTKDLNATNQELDATKQDVEDANASAQKAQADADAAEQQAARANDATQKAQAQAGEAQAQAAAAESKTEVVTDCAKAYTSAVGALFEGDDIEAQAAAVKEQLQEISADCKAAFGAP
jgi:cytoskeletal protein RodZ